MLAWSAEEAGRIIETYKIFENKPPDMIMEKQESSPYQKVLTDLTEESPLEANNCSAVKFPAKLLYLSLFRRAHHQTISLAI
jgi:hypothetical protein